MRTLSSLSSVCLVLLCLVAPASADDPKDAAELLVGHVQTMGRLMLEHRDDCAAMVDALEQYAAQNAATLRKLWTQLGALDPSVESELNALFHARLETAAKAISEGLKACPGNAELAAALRMLSTPSTPPVTGSQQAREVEGLCAEWLGLLESHGQDCAGLGGALHELFLRREAKRLLTQSTSGDEQVDELHRASEGCRDAIARTLVCAGQAEVKSAMGLLREAVE